jgi:hypothetical protein
MLRGSVIQLPEVGLLDDGRGVRRFVRMDPVVNGLRILLTLALAGLIIIAVSISGSVLF